MSKKHKANRKQVQQPAKKAVVVPLATLTRHAETDKPVTHAPVQIADAEPRAAATKESRVPPHTLFGYWTRAPFALMDMWFAGFERGKSPASP